MSLSMTASALCTSLSMRVKHVWTALAVPMVFDLVLDANGKFNAAFFAIAALVLGCWLVVCVVCRTLEVAVSLVCEDSLLGLSFRRDSLRKVTPRGNSLREFCCDESPWGMLFCKSFLPKVYCSISGTLEVVAYLFLIGTLGSVPCIDVASISRVRLQISCSCCAVTIGLRFRTLARPDMAFMILLACDRDGLVMLLCLKCTVLYRRSLWVGLMWHMCVF